MNMLLDVCDPNGTECCEMVPGSIIGDTVLEVNETFRVKITSDDPQVSISIGSANITIFNDDCKNLYSHVL